MKKITELYEEVITEAKFGAKEIVKLMKNREDWGDAGEMVRVVKGNLEAVDTFYYTGQDALDKLTKSWIDPNGHNAKYWKDEYGVSFKLVDQFIQNDAEGRYKKITKNGIVGVILKVI